MRILLIIVLLLLGANPSANAAVEIALRGQPPLTIQDVYLRDGVPYLAVEEVLAALGLSGKWDSVAHIYRINTPAGPALMSPGSHFLRSGDSFIPLEHPPRFIDGRLRVSEGMATVQLPRLLGLDIYYRNLTPVAAADPEASSLDRLFSFLLRKKTAGSGPSLRAVAIDAGHGGEDVGAIGLEGVKEKEVVLEQARRLEKLLKMRLGIPIYLSRDGDYVVPLAQRLQVAAKPDVDALLLLHAQAAFGPDSQGIVLLVRPQDEGAEPGKAVGEGDSMQLARSLQSELRTAGFKVATIVRAPLLPLGRGDLPTVLVELGYLSNAGDQVLLQSPAGQDRLAEALFRGLKTFADHIKETTP